MVGHRVLTGRRVAEDDLAAAVVAPLWQAADGEVEAAIELLDRLEARAAALRCCARRRNADPAHPIPAQPPRRC